MYLVKFNNQSFEGRAIKRLLLNYPILVTSLNLNEPGDFRYFYLHSNTTPLSVVVYTANTQPDQQATSWIQKMIVDTTGKQSVVQLIHDFTIPADKELTNDQLNQIRTALRKRFPDASLFVVYGGTYTEQPTNAGVTIHRDTMFIFKSRLTELSQNKAIIERLERSTIMHEWGHLLGLGHVDSEDCIMNEKVEVTGKGPAELNEIPVEYCVDELNNLNSLSLPV